jgi:hypothetical protein
MAAWLPVIKASLPYVTQIVTAAIPAFTSKSANTPPDEVVPKQIEELQAAVTHNAEAVKGLATQLKETIEAIDQSAVRLEAELARQRRMTLFAVLIAAVSAAIAITAVVVA